MNVRHIEIPPNFPEEARALIEGINRMLADVIRDIAAINKDPLSFSTEQLNEILKRSEYALQRFMEMRDKLRGCGLEWSDVWPDVVSDKQP